VTRNSKQEMMAFYYKKQEEAKKLEAESEDAYLNSAWANPKVRARRQQQRCCHRPARHASQALKAALTGTGAVSWRPH
jgi:hypothetical protein